MHKFVKNFLIYTSIVLLCIGFACALSYVAIDWELKENKLGYDLENGETLHLMYSSTELDVVRSNREVQYLTVFVTTDAMNCLVINSCDLYWETKDYPPEDIIECKVTASGVVIDGVTYSEYYYDTIIE